MKNNINLAFARILRKLRKDRKLTQEQLAEISSVDYKYLQKLESQNPSSPTLQILKKLAKGLNMPLTELIKQIEEETE